MKESFENTSSIHIKNKKSAFTLVELIVTATILVILSSIGFYSYVWNIADARDGVRKTDLASLGSNLELYKKKRGSYPVPGDNFQIINRGEVIAHQGRMNNSVSLSTVDKIPLDPELKIPYFYSITNNRQEYQLATTIDNSGEPFSFLQGDYSSVSKDVIPTLVLATNTPGGSLEISADLEPSNRNFFIFDQWYHTIPYDINTWDPYIDGSNFDTLLADAGDNFWQNTDYRTCSEIFEAGKGITPSGETDIYQILQADGTLTSTGCTAP